jgi:hypothetical protein
MKITRQAGDELVLEESTFWIAGFLAILTLPLLYAGIFGSDKRIFAPAGFLLLFAVAIARKSRVVFDARTRLVQWKMVVWLMAKTGSLAFDEITDVGIQSSMAGNSRVPTFRLTLTSRSGTMPLAAGYCAGSEAYSAMRTAILAIMGRGSATKPNDADASQAERNAVDPMVLELVRKRQIIPAIELLRTMNPRMSLVEAKMRVEAIEMLLKRQA